MWTSDGRLRDRRREPDRVTTSAAHLLLALLLAVLHASPGWSADATVGPHLVLQTAHAAEISALRYSADGQFVASASLDGTVRVWRATDAALLAETSAGRNMRRLLSMTDDGGLVAIMADGAVKVWDWRSDRMLASLRAPDRTAVFALSGDGRTLYLADAGRGLCAYRMATPAPIACRAAGQLSAILPAAAVLVTGAVDGRVTAWQPDLAGSERTLFTHGSRVTALRLVEGTHRLIVGGDGYMDEVDVESGTLTASRQLGAVAANVLAISPDGDFIASGKGTLASVVNDIEVLRWKGDASATFRIAGNDLPVTALAFSPDGAWLASGSIDSRIRLWAMASCLRTGRPPCGSSPTFSQPPRVAQLVSAAIDPNGRSFAVASTRWIATFDLASGQPNFVAGTGSDDFVATTAFSADGDELTSISTGGLLERLSTTSGAVLGTKHFHHPPGVAPVLATAARPADYAVASIDGERLLSKTLRTMARPGQDRRDINALAFSASGELLVQTSADATTVVDTRSGRTTRLSSGPVDFPAVAPNGSSVAGAVRDERAWEAGSLQGDSSEARLVAFEPTDGTRLNETPTDEPISTVAFSPDSRQLIYGTERGTVTILGTDDFHGIRSWPAHSGTVVTAKPIPNHPVLLTASADGSTKLWSSSDGRLLATIVVFSGGDWIAIAPSGYFDGTRAGWRLARMSFADEPTKLYAPAQFFAQFFQPGLIADVSRDGIDIARILAARGDPRSTLDMGLIRRASPAKVAVVGRVSRPGVAAVELHVDGAGSGARDCVVSRNGVAVARPDGSAIGALGFRTSLEIELAPGRNRISAFCFNDLRMKSADASITFVDDGSGRAPQRIAYVLAIGVDHYRGLYHDLRYARSDANAMAARTSEALRSTRRYAEVRQVVLTDSSASREEVLRAIDILSGKRAPADKADPLSNLNALRPQDALILYFSGHGVVVDREFYAIVHPTTQSKEMTQNVSADDLRYHLEPAQTGDILLILDTCSSGAALEGEDNRAGPLEARGLIQLAYEKGMDILAATQPDNVAYEQSSLRHGLLTYALAIEGLANNRAYDGRKGGRITAIDAMRFASRRVAELQRRRMLDAAAREVMIAYVPGESRLPPLERGVQRPQFFFRDEPGDEPMTLGRVTDAPAARRLRRSNPAGSSLQ